MVIKVGGIDYQVIFKDKLKDHKKKVWGMTNYEKGIISINTTLSEQKTYQTLIHEVTHAMFHEAGLDDYANDERIINPLGNIVYQFIKENPELVSLINNSDICD